MVSEDSPTGSARMRLRARSMRAISSACGARCKETYFATIARFDLQSVQNTRRADRSIRLLLCSCPLAICMGRSASRSMPLACLERHFRARTARPRGCAAACSASRRSRRGSVSKKHPVCLRRVGRPRQVTVKRPAAHPGTPVRRLLGASGGSEMAKKELPDTPTPCRC